MTAYGHRALQLHRQPRRADHIIPYVCLPAVALGALWLALVGRPALGVPPPAAGSRSASALAVSALLVAAAWSSVERPLPAVGARARRARGARRSRAALSGSGTRPQLRPEAVEGEQLLAEHMPGEDRSIVLTSADLSVEILMRAERGSAVPLGDPWEDSFVPEQPPRRRSARSWTGSRCGELDAPRRAGHARPSTPTAATRRSTRWPTTGRGPSSRRDLALAAGVGAPGDRPALRPAHDRRAPRRASRSSSSCRAAAG